MLLRIIDKAPRRKPRKATKADLDAEQAFVQMQARLDALPKFARTPRPKGMSLRMMPKLETPPGRTNTKHLKSLNASEALGDQEYRGTFKASPKYTGTKMLGVSVLHKSNGIPVFSNEEIKDISKMRR
jgi:hypothetical protein